MTNHFKNNLKVFSVYFLVIIGLVLESCSFAKPDIPKINQSPQAAKFRYESSINNVKLVIQAAVSDNGKEIDEEKISGIIQQNFIDPDPNAYSRVTVLPVYKENPNPDHLMVYLLSHYTSSFDVAKVTLDENYSIKTLEQGENVIKEDAEQSLMADRFEEGLSSDNLSNQSRNDDLMQAQFIFSTCLDDLTYAVNSIEYVYQCAIAKGYKAVKLIGPDENRANIKKFLASPNLIAWGRYGHGANVGIAVDDGALYYTYFNSLSSSALNHKVLFFDSCNVHLPPLQPSIVNAGVQKYIGGARQLGIGSADIVFMSFWKRVLLNNEPISQALYNAQLEYYHDTTAYGISGEGSDYLAISDSTFFNQTPLPTPMTTPSPMITPTAMITITPVMTAEYTLPPTKLPTITPAESPKPEDHPQLIFSTCNEDSPAAVNAINYVYDLSISYGYKAVKLIGTEENKNNVKKWLTSADVNAWGRIGGGDDVGLILADGVLYYNYFDTLSSSALKNKMLFFCSNNSFNPPLRPAILKKGVQRYIGATKMISSGPSIEMFKEFWSAVIKNQLSFTKALNESQMKYYNTTGVFDLTGDGPDYLYSKK